jgi:UDP-galactopyranose mutase
MKKKCLIIGGGFAGCSAAHLIGMSGKWDIDLVEKNSFLGAGVRTFWKGGHPFTFGPRHFLTQNEETYHYLNKYCPLRNCSEHQYLTYIEQDAAFYNFPMHKDDISIMPDKDIILKELENAELANKEIKFSPSGEITSGGDLLKAKNLEEFWEASVGKTLYSKFVENYNKKMWLVDDNKVIDNFGWSPKGVALKEGPRESWDDAISAYPIAADGYNKYFDLSVENINLYLNTSIDNFDIPNKTVIINSGKKKYDIIVNTISPDLIMDNIHGELPFIGRDLELFVLPVKEALPENVYFLYYAGKEKYTRIVEYKKLTKQNMDHPTTLLSIEYPSKNGNYYPVPLKAEIAKAKRYLDDMPDGVFSIGRAGSYDYGVDIDDCIEQAMEVAEILK